MIVQIYEIQIPEEAEKCIKLGVDHIGSVILSKEDWKNPKIKEVIQLTKGTRAKNTLIPLFSHLERIFKCLDYYEPDFVHFCDTLTDDRGCILDLSFFLELQRKVKEEFPEIGIIRSIPISKNGQDAGPPSLLIGRELEPVTDIFLTDTWLGKEPVEGFIGITGKTLDWNVAAHLVDQSSIPVILAGGLCPENVFEALLKVKPAGADSCTGTNMSSPKGKPIRFKKDFDRVERFVQEVRRASKILGK